jgi:NitT/TauT family transport system substrate-binding protein
VASIHRGEIAAISNIDPVMGQTQVNRFVIMAPLRITEWTNSNNCSVPGAISCSSKVIGGPMSAAVLYAKSLQWLRMRKATPDEIAAAVPQDDWLGDKALYTAAVRANLQSIRGTASSAPRAASARSICSSRLTRKIAGANIDGAKTWDDRFVKKAAATLR